MRESSRLRRPHPRTIGPPGFRAAIPVNCMDQTIFSRVIKHKIDARIPNLQNPQVMKILWQIGSRPDQQNVSQPQVTKYAWQETLSTYQRAVRAWRISLPLWDPTCTSSEYWTTSVASKPKSSTDQELSSHEPWSVHQDVAGRVHAVRSWHQQNHRQHWRWHRVLNTIRFWSREITAVGQADAHGVLYENEDPKTDRTSTSVREWIDSEQWITS